MKTCPYCGFPNLSQESASCPKCGTDLGAMAVDEGRIEGTRLSLVDRTPTRKEQAGKDQGRSGTLPFRPVNRPSMAIVTILDDGQGVGQIARVRQGSFVLGRTEGAVTIPHDTSVSSRHVELVRVDSEGESSWFVQDLGSTNGTFARIEEGLLRHGQEVLLGSRRYRFDASSQARNRSPEPGRETGSSQGTVQWQAASPVVRENLSAALVELVPDGDGDRLTLPTESTLVGSDRALCALVVPNDPFLSPRHAHIYRDDRGRWHIMAGSECLNGVWVRIERMRIDASGQFQIGEQRFTVRIP